MDFAAIPVASIASPSGLEELVRLARPVVLHGLIEHWPALAAGRESPAALNGYLKSLDRGIPGPVMEAPASSAGRFGYGPDLREFTFSKRQRGVPETLDRLERQLGQAHAPSTTAQPSSSGQAFLAIQMLPLATHMPEFLRQNPFPLLPQVPPLLWLGGPVKTQTHHDRDHNIACVIAGRRRFVLFPPEQVINLYIGPIENPPPLSLVDLEAPDLARFPRFAAALASAVMCELGPGEALFIPRHWWHHVSSLEPYNALVNYWWGTHAAGLENPYDCFLVALLALKRLPAAERRYWQAMFNAFVFQSDDGAVDHIPAELRGALGNLDAGTRAALKQKLKAGFLR
jgi:hypothetical protein